MCYNEGKEHNIAQNTVRNGNINTNKKNTKKNNYDDDDDDALHERIPTMIQRVRCMPSACGWIKSTKIARPPT